MAERCAGDAEDLRAIAEVLRGNIDAYRDIVRRHQQNVFRLAKSFLKNHEDAKDATQEIFTKAYRLLHTYSLDKRFVPWLYTVTMNQLRTIYGRHRRFDREEELLEIEDHTYTPLDEVIRKERQRLIQRGVERLPRPVRETFVLYYLEEMTVEEVATVLKISKENVKSRLFRGRKALRGILVEPTTLSGVR